MAAGSPVILTLNAWYRVIFGLLFGALFIGLIFIDSWASSGWPAGGTPPGLVVAIVSLIVIPMAIWEMRKLLALENVQISMRITVVASMLCMLWPWIEQVSESESSPWHAMAKWFRSVKPHYLVPTILALSLVAAFIKHSRNKRVEAPWPTPAALSWPSSISASPGFFLPICMTHSAWMMLAIVCVVKCADIGANVTGRLTGRHKLIPWLSPGKTIEGFIGGLALAGIIGAVIAAMFQTWAQNNLHEGDRWHAIGLAEALLGGSIAGIVLGAVGQLGDLLESLLKRDAGVKDSGAVPGFGGVLDILDSPLLAAPVAYWMLKILLPPVIGAGAAATMAGGG